MLIMRRRPSLSDKETEEETSQGRGDQRESIQKSRCALRHAELAHQGGEHDGIEHDVEGIEHPAEARGHYSAALRRGSVAPAKRKNS